MTHFKDYTELSVYMDKLGLFHMDLTLGRMEAFWEARGLPEVKIIHVVGTNGKGSTSTFLCSLARAHSLKVGLFTSPHFVTPRERVQINRAMMPRFKWVSLANEILDTPGGDKLTYFEFQTCLAMLAFEQAKVDVAIMEAGLGGMYDATNVFKPNMTLFTPIGYDHEKILGPTLTDIARDKAGAIHEGSVVLTGAQEAEAMIQLQDRAEAVGARFMHAVDIADPIKDVSLGLKGMHQSVNARLALAAWRWFAAAHENRSLPECEQFGLECAFIPGRMQFVEMDGRTIILDGAHNAHAVEALGCSLGAEDINLGAVIFACLEDKEIDAMLPSLRALTEGTIYVPHMKSERAGDPKDIIAAIGEQAVEVASLQDALTVTKDVIGPTLVCGSLYLLAEFYENHPEFLTV